MGCHAAINALAVARSICRSDESACVMVCCVELCSLHLGYGWSMDRVVANALFADAAGAVVVSNSDDARQWEIVETASVVLPESQSQMTWTITDHGFAMTLSPDVPKLVESHVGAWCKAWLGESASSIDKVNHWAIHPGGPKVLTAAARGLAIEESHLATSQQVLRDHGNVSSATVLLILDRLRAASGSCVSLAFGPGLVMEGLLLRRA
jgi:predicted naringenin-chalcone synthase